MPQSVSDEGRWSRLGQLGVDLAVITMLAVLGGAIHTSLLPVSEPTRILSGVLLLFLLPGYALIAALFPQSQPILARSPASESTFFGREDEPSDEARTLVRLTLSVVTSVAAASLLGTALGTTVGFTTVRLAAGLTTFAVACSLIAVIRRATLQPGDRYVPTVGDRLVAATRSLGRGRRFGGILQLFVIVSLLLSMGSAAYAVSVPQQGETPTEMYLLTENETGELTAEGYPKTLRPNEEQTLYVGVTNQEQTRQQFTVVVTLDRVVSTGNSSVIIERAEITRFSRPLLPNQWWQQRYEIEPLLRGSNLRLTHHLYRGDAPEEVATDEAYRVTYLWLSAPETSPASNESTQASNETTSAANDTVQLANDSVQPGSESPQSGDQSTGSNIETTAGNETTESDTENPQSGDESTAGNGTTDAENEQSLNESA